MASAARHTSEDRARLLGEWEASGVSAAEFASRAGVTAHTLYAWRRRARADMGTGAGGGAGRFAEVVVRPSSAGPATAIDAGAACDRIEIAVGEAVVRVGETFDEAHLRRVLDVVRAMA